MSEGESMKRAFALLAAAISDRKHPDYTPDPKKVIERAEIYRLYIEGDYERRQREAAEMAR